MNTNHAKAIKGMSIANIVLAALGICGALISWFGIGLGGAAVSGSGYDYFYTENGMYFTVDDVNMLLGILGFFVFLMCVACVLVLIAGILGVRGADKPEKLKGVMIWNIVGAVVAFCSGTWISLVLCIIVAVFANKDKNLYAASAPMPAYAAPMGAPMPQQPYAAPAVPVQPAAPVQPVSDPAPVTPTEPVAVAAVTEKAVVTPAEPTPAEVEAVAAEAEVAAEHAADPAVVVPDNYIEDAVAGVTVTEVVEAPAEGEDKPEA